MRPKSIMHLNMCLALSASPNAAQLSREPATLVCSTGRNTAQGLFAHKTGRSSELEAPASKQQAFRGLRRPPAAGDLDSATAWWSNQLSSVNIDLYNQKIN